jgi:signal transduction histidine kinase
MYMALRMIRLIPSPEKQQSYFDLVMRECEQEISLLDDWLDIEKLRAQQYRLSYKPINLNFWLPDMIAGFEVRAQQRQQILRLDVPSPLPLLTTDLTSLDRILQELLNNASKYSAVGSQIFLQVELVDQGFRFSVSNPAQIPKEALPHLWEKFYRVPQGDLHQQGGTGLGLTLVKMMVEQLQGSITVTSNAGCTTFSLWIPNLTL